MTFSLTFGFLFPLQQLLLSGASTQVGLLVLSHMEFECSHFHFYGWRGMVYLLPGELPDDFTICGAHGTQISGRLQLDSCGWLLLGPAIRPAWYSQIP